jgi:tetratricopeptide (TPR) repeat protein
MVKLYTAIVFLLFLGLQSQAQRLVDVINQAEKSVVVVRAYSKAGTVLQQGSGFVISADGMAVIPSNLLLSGDSVLVETRGGSKLGIARVLQIHKQANLSLVKLALGNKRELSFLLPSRPLFQEKQEMIIFGHPDEVEDGLTYGTATAVKYQVFLNRIGILNAKLSRKSFGAPVINNKGEFIGIVNAIDIDKEAFLVDCKLLNDSNWIDVNLTTRQSINSIKVKTLLTGDYNEALLRLIWNDGENAARVISNYIKINSSDADAYAVRAHARYLYKNTYGCREDIAISKKLNATGFLPYYFDGLHLNADEKRVDALVSFTLCLNLKPTFSLALVEHGRALLTVKNNLEGAYADYLMCVRSDSTYGAGFYERGRFILQYIEDKRPAINDINKAIALDGSLPGVYTIRGTMRIEDQNYLAAINDFNRALERDPKDASAFFNRGIANYNLGMKDKACKDWQSAANLGHYKAVKYMSRYCNSLNRSY